ncbi:hypothetical protein BGZ93_002549 [Podila epicladia]|nr:hypothetical protein BGZ92_005873 [Podila epicladia]KAG0100312.1 hypothetical protein BGZ93_002549 [Podila epicladia]
MAHQLRTFANSSNVLLVTQMITIGSMGVFAGGALSYSTMVMPTLRKFASTSSLAVWCEMYLIAKPIQISMIAISSLGAAALYYQTRNQCYLIGSLMMVSLVPYTISLLYPINHKLLDIRKSGKDDPRVEEMLVRWDALAFGRTMASYGAMFITLYGALRPSTR